MESNHQSDSPSLDMLMQVVLGVAFFVATSLFIAWPGLHPVVS